MFFDLKRIGSLEERSKFEILYLEYKDAMYTVANSILHNSHDAEDAVHHAFVKIAENMHKIGDPKCPETLGYVMKTVKNRAIDIYRRKQAYPVVPYNEEIAGIHMEHHGTNDLAASILKLPARQRDVITLKYCHGYKLKEIANILGISYANALKIEQRAKEKLKALCQETENEG